MIDLTAITSLADMHAALVQVTEAYQALQRAQAEEHATRRARLAGTVGTLEDLLGAEGASPYDPAGDAPPTIRSVGAHTPEVMAANAGIALDLILSGLEVLTATVLDLARLVAESQES